MASAQVDNAAQETTDQFTPLTEENLAKPSEETEAAVYDIEKEEKSDEDETETDDWMIEKGGDVAASPIIEEAAPAPNHEEAEAEAEEEDDEINEE